MAKAITTPRAGAAHPQRSSEALGVRSALYAMLVGTNRAVRSARSRQALFQEACRVAVETGGFRLAWVGIPVEGRFHVAARAGLDGGYLEHVFISANPSDERSQGPMGRAFNGGQPVVENDALASPMMAPWYALAKGAGFASVAAFPLKEHGVVTAVLCLYAGAVGFFTEDLVDTLSEVTPILSLALDGFLREQEGLRDKAALDLRDRAIAAAAQGLLIADCQQPGTPIVYASPGVERLTGYGPSELLGRNCRFLQGKDTDPSATATIREAVRAGRGCAVELLNYRKDGTPFWNSLSLSPVTDARGELTHYVGVQTDVTQRRQLEAELRQAQKMEAVGQFAAGVAHDFNNLLSVVMSYSELMLTELEPANPLREDLEEIRRAGERATGLARQLLTFSRQQVLQPRVLELGALLDGMQKMLRRLLGEDIELEVLPSVGLHTVHADPTGLEQVLMNLVVNARDAMPHGGTLSIALEAVELSALDHPLASAGPYVVLTVTDTGEGMDPATRERIFEPFFTTKEKGKGTGLGLSTVFGIVRQSNGLLTVHSEKGHGASFKVFLPQVRGADDAVGVAGPARARLSGTETILVAEDDEQVCAVACAILQRAGYTVVGAHNAGEAFLLCEHNPARFDLLLSDLLMPHLNGPQLAARLQKLRPQLRVLFMSGYGEAALQERGAKVPSGVQVLRKPILPEPLLVAVRAALDAPALAHG